MPQHGSQEAPKMGPKTDKNLPTNDKKGSRKVTILRPLTHFRPFFITLKKHDFLTPHFFLQFLIFRSCVSFRDISEFILGPFFRLFFFCWQLEATPDPSGFFFRGPRGRPGARKCVRGVVFLHSSGSLLTSFLDPKNLPKLALLNFQTIISSDFIASLKFSKNSRGQLGPQEGPGRPLQEAKNGLRSRLRVGVRFCTDFGPNLGPPGALLKPKLAS